LKNISNKDVFKKKMVEEDITENTNLKVTDLSNESLR